MFNLIETAFAASSDTTATTGGMTSTLVMVVAMVAIFYFLMIRPENKRKKEAEQMRNSLKRGNWVTTIGGLYGRVVAVTERTVILETSEDRVRVEFLKSAVSAVGTLDQQVAAAQRGGRKGKKVEEEAPAVEEKAAEEAKTEE